MIERGKKNGKKERKEARIIEERKKQRKEMGGVDCGWGGKKNEMNEKNE